MNELANQNDIIGRGWAFPIRPGADGRMPLLGGDDKVRQSVWLILTTAPGERVMRPAFGCSIHELLFEPNTSTLRALVRAKVMEALTRYEPRIDVLGVEVASSEEQANRLDISIGYRIRSNNAAYNMVYPFFLIEGAG